MFVKYKDLDNDSNVNLYEIGDTYIRIVFFNTKRIYTYSYEVAGREHVENMKELAIRGDGLNAYIQNNCRYLYDR